MLQIDIETDQGASQIYDLLDRFSGKILLDDSARRQGQRYSLLGLLPRTTLVIRDKRFLLKRREGGLEIVGDFLSAARIMLSELSGLGEIPRNERVFSGGLMGFLGYELNQHFEQVSVANPRDSGLPDAVLGAYDLWLEIDEERKGTVRILSLDETESAEERMAAIANVLQGASGFSAEEERSTGESLAISSFSKSTYLSHIRAIQDYIRAGDVYQVNLTQRFLLPVNDRPIVLFEKIRRQHGAPFGAFMEWDGAAISSHSPESFVKLRGPHIESQPIKGTIGRSPNPVIDEALKSDLLNSEKDKAELAMIVDLMRNDFSRVCRPGTVTVHDHAHIQTAPTVHHLVSRVCGRLKEGLDFFDFLKAAWPGGSITGAPKIRAMEVINELEPLRRGPYTGSIGYLGVDGRGEWNIAIRTVVFENGYARVHGGGGIVIDSNDEAEYAESVVKVAGILKALKGVVKD